MSLQRSQVSFRRQGSSGLVWNDRFLSGDLNQMKQKEEEENKIEFRDLRPSQSVGSIGMMKRSKSDRGTTRVMEPRKSDAVLHPHVQRSGKVSPPMDPPSPKVSGCGFCGIFGKPVPSHRHKPGKRKA